MAGAKTPGNMSKELLWVAETARSHPQVKMHALARFIGVPVLAKAFRRLRKDAAVGVDGVTVESFEADLKENGKTRPIGVSTVEDKVVQGAIRDVLQAVYEQEFKDFSYGFRPGRRPHDAIRALDGHIMRQGARYILEADIVSFFDSIDRKMLMEMLRERIADESLMRLVGKCLHVGVLDGEEYCEPEEGTAQGSALSPLLGNIYLHHVIDVWFEDMVKPSMRGKAALVRYADDFVICFERHDDAVRVEKALRGRMAKYGLTLHPEKTRLLKFSPPPAGGGGKGSGTFDFLGFTVYWRRSFRGNKPVVAFKTRRARLGRALKVVADWCRRYRHRPVEEQHAKLTRKLQGHYDYFGVNGNIRSLKKLQDRAERSWQKWLNRRSQRARMTWERFKQVLKKFPLPEPQITIQIWANP